MKVAIVGSSGYIAKYILQRFSEEKNIEYVLKIDMTSDVDVFLNLAEPDKFDYGSLDEIDYIVFTAAISGPDQCAKEYDKCWQINVIGTKKFIREAIRRNCRVLFFSSDAVFGDNLMNIYDEDSITCATTAYGVMKKNVEDEFKTERLFKAIRLSYVASSNDRFVSYCLKCIRDNEEAVVFHPFYRNVIVVSDVVDVVIYFAFHWENYTPTFLNVAGKELVSRIRIADELNRIYGNRLKYSISIPDENFFKNRPRITQMNSIYLKKYKIIKEDNFTEKITRELEGIII